MKKISLAQYGYDRLSITVYKYKQPKIYNKGRLVYPSSTDTGYQVICYGDKGKKLTLYVHRLVMLAAYGPHPDPQKNCVNHINHNPSDNGLKNLEWCSFKENTQAAIKYGRGTKITFEETRRLYEEMEAMRDILETEWLTSLKTPFEIANKYGTRVRLLNKFCKKEFGKRPSLYNRKELHGLPGRLEVRAREMISIISSPQFEADWRHGMTYKQLSEKYKLAMSRMVVHGINIHGTKPDGRKNKLKRMKEAV